MNLPKSDHFELKELAAGVYAAQAIPGGAAFSNAGIVDLGNHTIIFDTFETPRAAEDLRSAAENLTGRPATWVILSHGHGDHWLGNQVFAGHAALIATHAARQLMAAYEPEIEAQRKDPSEYKAWLAAEQEKLEKETDPEKRIALEHSVARIQYALEALPGLKPCLPEQTFTGRLVFHGTERTAELVAPGHAHTPGDCYLALAEDGVVLMGDLGFFGREPFVGQGDPQGWVAALDTIQQAGFETFAPGHGPLGGVDEVTQLREYILALDAWVTQAVKDGLAVEKLLEGPLPEPLGAWSGDRILLGTNVQALYQRKSSANSR